MLICVHLQTSFLTPPFGWALFFLRGAAPPEVATKDIDRGAIPLVLMQVAGVATVFPPALATWLPKAVGWARKRSPFASNSSTLNPGKSGGSVPCFA